MAPPPMKKVVKLRIKVPANVTVVTELIPTPGELAFTPAKGTEMAAASLEMDLTTAKTSQWLSSPRKLLVGDVPVGCCVRG